jgi:hypothetical protein
MRGYPSVFSTLEVRPCFDPRTKNSIKVPVPSNPGSFPIGLTSIDADHRINTRVIARFGNVEDENGKLKATVNIDTWLDSTLYSASCTWLSLSDKFQGGRRNVTRLDQKNSHWSTQIEFGEQYDSAPNIVVWLCMLDVDRNTHCRVKAYANSITAIGFMLHVETWNDTVLYGTSVSWAAHPATHPSITSGDFNTSDVRLADKLHNQDNEKTFTFKAYQFQHPPRVLVALNSLDVSRDHNLRIRTFARDVTAENMTLNISTWGDTKVFSAGASYLAIEE